MSDQGCGIGTFIVVKRRLDGSLKPLLVSDEAGKARESIHGMAAHSPGDYEVVEVSPRVVTLYQALRDDDREQEGLELLASLSERERQQLELLLVVPRGEGGEST